MAPSYGVRAKSFNPECVLLISRPHRTRTCLPGPPTPQSYYVRHYICPCSTELKFSVATIRTSAVKLWICSKICIEFIATLLRLLYLSRLVDHPLISMRRHRCQTMDLIRKVMGLHLAPRHLSNLSKVIRSHLRISHRTKRISHRTKHPHRDMEILLRSI